jgi:hypothetical protein
MGTIGSLTLLGPGMAGSRIAEHKGRLIALRKWVRRMPTLLAVDLGLRTGYALYGQDGRLLWYRSKNFGTAERLRRGVRGLLDETPDLGWLVLEGGGPLADIWEREARHRKIGVIRVSAEQWRRRLLVPREQSTGRLAKRNAGTLARRVIEECGAARPTSLRHDAAEAILVGRWGVEKVGWLPHLRGKRPRAPGKAPPDSAPAPRLPAKT